MLAMTMGDPAGIGGEIAAKAWQALHATGPGFMLLDDPARIAALGVPVRTVRNVDEARQAFATALPVLPIPLTRPAVPGTPDPANAAAVIASIEQAVRLVQSGAARAVVTNPIAKHVLYAAGFAHPGHTEFLGELTGRSCR